MATMSILGLYYWNNDILAPLLDAAPEHVDKESLSAELLAQCAELEVLYPDPDAFAAILSAWCSGRKMVWDRIDAALTAEYNITENYNRSEEWTDTGTGTTKSENYYKGYPENSALVKQAENSGENGATSTHTGNTHGNTGIYTTQELIKQEIELAAKSDLQQYIINDFKNRFCLLVY